MSEVRRVIDEGERARKGLQRVHSKHISEVYRAVVECEAPTLRLLVFRAGDDLVEGLRQLLGELGVEADEEVGFAWLLKGVSRYYILSKSTQAGADYAKLRYVFGSSARGRAFRSRVLLSVVRGSELLQPDLPLCFDLFRASEGQLHVEHDRFYLLAHVLDCPLDGQRSVRDVVVEVMRGLGCELLYEAEL